MNPEPITPAELSKSYAGLEPRRRVPPECERDRKACADGWALNWGRYNRWNLRLGQDLLIQASIRANFKILKVGTESDGWGDGYIALVADIETKSGKRMRVKVGTEQALYRKGDSGGWALICWGEME